MSVVKTVKGRRALLAALEQPPKDKLRWWDHKQRILEQWLETSGDEIAVEGASDLIRGQLDRGYRHEHLRIKCWKHIVIELSALVDDDTSSATAPSNGASAAMTRRGGSVGSNAGHQRTSSAFNGGDDISPGGLDGCDEDGNVDLNGLSFVERQEEWLRRKQNSLRSKANDLERAAKDAATFNPNLVISQSSLRPAQVSAVESKLEEMATEAERHARRSSFSVSIQEAKRRTEREAAPPASTGSNNSGQRRRSRMKRRGTGGLGTSPPRRATAPAMTFGDADGDGIDHPNPQGEDDSDDGLDHSNSNNNSNSNAGENGTGEAGDDGGVGGGAGGEEGGADGKQGEGDGEPEQEPFEKGSFFYKVDDRDKGYYKVRDVSRFLLTSMYKRKDRVTRTPGVSLLVGKLEDPPHMEKVISALFDTDRFSEREAARWWEDNGHRFEDAGSLAEKKEIDEGRRRTIERNIELLRRVSAPARAADAAAKARSVESSNSPPFVRVGTVKEGS